MLIPVVTALRFLLLSGWDGFQEVSVTHPGKIYVGSLHKQLQLEVFPVGGPGFSVFRFLFCWDLGSSEVEVEGQGRASQQAWKYTRILPAPSPNTHLLMGKWHWGAKLALTFHLFHLTFHCSPCSWIFALLALKRIHNSSPLYFALSALFWCRWM